ncbi:MULTISPECIES: hypothetical protein [unclassified Nonomuraea]|uniref:hypothetical protein n=1 Tax=unclassified Nonomuraea TaxID=2593643 RepID=UPI0033EE0271
MTRNLDAYLGQGQYWMSKAGEFPVAEMDAIYRRRALHWLTRNAAELYRLWTVEAYVEADSSPDLETLIKWVDSRPQNWVKGTALYAALMEGVPQELIP